MYGHKMWNAYNDVNAFTVSTVFNNEYLSNRSTYQYQYKNKILKESLILKNMGV